MSEIPKKFAKVEMLKRAYIEGHAVGKVEGHNRARSDAWNEALEAYRIGIGQSYIKWTEEEICELMDIGTALRKEDKSSLATHEHSRGETLTKRESHDMRVSKPPNITTEEKEALRKKVSE